MSDEINLIVGDVVYNKKQADTMLVLIKGREQIFRKIMDTFRDCVCTDLVDHMANGGKYDEEFACKWNGLLNKVIDTPELYFDILEDYMPLSEETTKVINERVQQVKDGTAKLYTTKEMRDIIANKRKND